MNTPTALHARPSPVDPPGADAPLGLVALLEMFGDEDTATARPSARRALRSSLTRLHAGAQEWLRRATLWGAGPGGAWRAW